MIIRFFIALSLISCLISCPTYAGVIFEDDFNIQSDFSAPSIESSHSVDGYTGGATTTPTGWSYWRNSEKWNPDDPTYPTSGSQAALQISGSADYGLSGGNKAAIIHNEARPASDGWGADAILQKMFETTYDELWYQAKIKMQPSFLWDTTYDYPSVPTIKMLRVEHYQNNNKAPRFLGTSSFLNFQDGNNGPAYLFYVSNKESPYFFRANNNFRCSPVEYDYVEYSGSVYRCILAHVSDGTNGPGNATYWSLQTGLSADGLTAWSDLGINYYPSNYTCTPSYDVASSVFLNDEPANDYDTTWGDDGWHTVKIHVKMNSALGAADGVLQLFIDGNLSKELTNVVWREYYAEEQGGWNSFAIGGNAINRYSGLTNLDPYESGAEQWYAIDDVVVSTTDIPADYVIGGATHRGGGSWIGNGSIH